MRKRSNHRDLPQTRAEAIAAGSAFYLGTPCVNGHLVARKVSTRRCVECSRDASKRYSRGHKNPKGWYRAHLKRAYGITLETYDGMAEAQQHRCGVCATPDLGFGSSAKRNRHHWSVDHCHVTGRIRGLLCQPCNHMLGNARDNAQVLKAGARYLENMPNLPMVSTALLSMGM